MLARLRRIGQMRPEVHLWRFVASGTVEEHLVELRARHGTGVLGSEPALVVERRVELRWGWGGTTHGASIAQASRKHGASMAQASR